MNRTRRNRVNAALLSFAGQAVAITAAVILGYTVYKFTAGHGAWTIATTTITAIGILLTVSTFTDDLFGPSIDRLRGTDTTGADQ